MSSLAYLHQTNILYSRLSTRYNADIEEQDKPSNNPIRLIQSLIAPAALHLRSLFLPYKGHKRAFLLKQYTLQQAHIRAYAHNIITAIKQPE